MYDNIGKKIKVLTKILTGSAIVLSFATCFILALNSSGGDTAKYLIAAPIIAVVIWVSSFFMYGFGELIDKTCDIERNTRKSVRVTVNEEKETD